MSFKKSLSTLSILLFLFTINNVSAYDLNSPSTTIQIVQNKEITRKDFFIFLANYFRKDLPTSYKYINLKFRDVSKDDELNDALQSLVYIDLIKNKEIKISGNKPIGAYLIYKFIEDNFEVYSIPENESKESLKKRNATLIDLENIKTSIENVKLDIKVGQGIDKLSGKKKVFSDVYETLLTSHFDKTNLSEDKLIDGAIEGLTKATGDKFTTYFPPTENKSFEEDLNGKYEGIGAYVDMETPGEFKIISPISGTPSEKAGLKGGDIVISVDGKKVTKENTLKEVVSWVKGPAGTKVKLEISRGEDVFFVEIERAKITIKEVESRSLNSNTQYIQIKTFGDTVSSEFSDSLESLKVNNNIKNLVIDLRNNPGGYLDQVIDMLGNFVEEGKPVAVVKYIDYKSAYKSNGYIGIDFSKYNIYILQNGGTASASEIMIGTIKDYYPKAVLVGENTYGKGSVQTIKPYEDGSSLKYTVAKWFTGKTETGINGVGIKPDIEVKLDEAKFINGIDSQLEKVLELINK